MGDWAIARSGKLDGYKESGTVTVHAAVFARVQMVQKVEETLNKFKQTCLVISMLGQDTELWRGGVGGNQVEGCDWEKVILICKVSPLSKQYLLRLPARPPHHEPPLL